MPSFGMGVTARLSPDPRPHDRRRLQRRLLQRRLPERQQRRLPGLVPEQLLRGHPRDHLDLAHRPRPRDRRPASRARCSTPAACVLGHDRQYSQGFALKTAPSIDFFVTRRFFIGGKVDFIWNFHREVCTADGGSKVCLKKDDNDQASVHQMIVGFHLGTTF